MQHRGVHKFWFLDANAYSIVQQHRQQQQQQKPMAASVKTYKTKAERKKALVANYEPLAEAIASSNSKTNTEISLVKERIINATQSKKSHVGKRKSPELGPDDDIVPNPPTAKMQKQKRRQPSAIGAPTTKLNKKASRESKRVRKQSEKAKINDLMGR